MKWRELVKRGNKKWEKLRGRELLKSKDAGTNSNDSVSFEPESKHTTVTQTTVEQTPRENDEESEIQVIEEDPSNDDNNKRLPRRPGMLRSISKRIVTASILTRPRRTTTNQTLDSRASEEEVETKEITLCQETCRGCRKIKDLAETDKTSGKTYQYRSLPMVVAQFALMGGFILKLEDADNDWEKWKKKAKENQSTTNKNKKMELMMQGLRPNDEADKLLEDLNAETFITTIRGRGFFQLMSSGAFDGHCIRRRIAQKSAHEIVDKCKADSVSKALVCIQVTWMLLNVFARIAKRLPVTLLETHVVIQVGIAILTYAFWWNKPLDAQEAIEIKVPKKMIEVILKKRDKEAFYFRSRSRTYKESEQAQFTRKNRLGEFMETGLYAFLKFPQFHIPDFITESTESESFFESFMRAGYDICETFFDLYWHTGELKTTSEDENSNQKNALFNPDDDVEAKANGPEISVAGQHTPHVNRSSTQKTVSFTGTETTIYAEPDNYEDDADNDKKPLSSVHRYAVIITAFMGVLDCALHLTAWSLYFPTELESLVWKIACFIGGGLPIFLFASKGNQLEYYPAILCFGPRRFAKGKYTLWRCIGDCVRTFHRIGTMKYGKELHSRWYRELPLPVRFFIAYGMLVGALVCILSLAYINFEAGFAMRRLPEASYKSIRWIEYIPHF